MKCKVKKFLAAILAAIIAQSGSIVIVSAHNGDIHSGVYNSGAMCNQSNLNFKIDSSAQTSLLTYIVYNTAYAWSSTSTGVSVNVVMSSPGMPTYGFYNVYGLSYYDGTLGTTIPRDSSGNIVDMDSNWNSVSICICAADNVFADSTAAAKTFVHEVGHALKLKHPISNYTLTDHIYLGGVPKAIMNQGLPSSSQPWIATSIQTHDIYNITAKWGN